MKFTNNGLRMTKF